VRILLFSDTYLPTINGVAGALGHLVEHASSGGHEVGLVTPRVSPEPAAGAAFHVQLPALPLPIYPELQAARPWLDRQQRRALGAFEPDVVHVATEALVGLVGQRWARGRRLPLVTSYCTNFAEYAAGYGLGWAAPLVWGYLRRFHGKARVTLCPSDATRAQLRERGFHPPIGIWSRGVDAELFHPRRRDEALRARIAPGAEVILMYVGRIAPEKRIELLLDAFPRVRAATERRIALVLVGDGPALESLRARGIEGVHFTGYRRGEELATHYASADVFVFPSDTETFGQVVVEALASGLPVVAPARGGVTDHVVPGRTGWLFAPGDARALAERVLALIEDEVARLAMGACARAHAEGRSWGGVFERLLELYTAASRDRDPPVTAPSAGRRERGPIFEPGANAGAPSRPGREP
jgi:glycosyltransferase involved in cell wall biosynthesis